MNITITAPSETKRKRFRDLVAERLRRTLARFIKNEMNPYMLLLLLLLPAANDRSQKAQNNRSSVSGVRRAEGNGSRVRHDVPNSAGRNRRSRRVRVAA